MATPTESRALGLGYGPDSTPGCVSPGPELRSNVGKGPRLLGSLRGRFPEETGRLCRGRATARRLRVLLHSQVWEAGGYLMLVQ